MPSHRHLTSVPVSTAIRAPPVVALNRNPPRRAGSTRCQTTPLEVGRSSSQSALSERPGRWNGRVERGAESARKRDCSHGDCPPTLVGLRGHTYSGSSEDKGVEVQLLLFESFGGFGKGVREILRRAADVLQNKLTRAQYLDEVTWTTKSWLGLQKQRISVVLHTAIAEQIVNELACGEGGRVHGAKCLAVLAGVA